MPYIDRDNLVTATKEKVFHTVMEGIGLVCIVLILFLGSPRSALVAAVAIPMSLVTVFILMQFTRMPANLFSLGAIDFGVIVDGAIVVTEAILRQREMKPTEVLVEEDVMLVTRHVGRSIFFATLIIITAYFPLFAFEHAEGKLFRPMAFTVSYALLAALLCTVTLTPALAFLALRKPRKIFENKPLKRLQEGFSHTLGRLLHNLPVAYGIAAVAFCGVLILGATIGREFLPDLDEGALWLQVQMPTGLSLDKASDMAAQLRKAVREFPEVSYIVTQLGRNDTGSDPWTPSHIESGVGLTPYSTWHGETKAQFLRKFNARLQQIPGITVGISQPIIDGENDMVGGAHAPLVLRIYGQDFERNAPYRRPDGRCDQGSARHRRCINLSGAADSSADDHGGPRCGGALWRQRWRHHQPDPDRDRRRRRSPRSMSRTASITLPRVCRMKLPIAYRPLVRCH